MFAADVLQHADRYERVKSPGNIPIVVLDELHPPGQSFVSCLHSRILNLFTGDIEGFHGNAVMFRHVQREGAPAAACVHNCFSGSEPNFPADVFHFCQLGLFERRRGGGKVGARVKPAANRATACRNPHSSRNDGGCSKPTRPEYWLGRDTANLKIGGNTSFASRPPAWRGGP